MTATTTPDKVATVLRAAEDLVTRCYIWETEFEANHLHAEAGGLPDFAARRTEAADLAHASGRIMNQLLELIQANYGACAICHRTVPGTMAITGTTMQRSNWWEDREQPAPGSLDQLDQWRITGCSGREAIYCPDCWFRGADRYQMETRPGGSAGIAHEVEDITCSCGNSCHQAKGFFSVEYTGEIIAREDPRIRFQAHPDNYWTSSRPMFRGVSSMEVNLDSQRYAQYMGCKACGAVHDLSAALANVEEDAHRHNVPPKTYPTRIVGIAIPPEDER